MQFGNNDFHILGIVGQSVSHFRFLFIWTFHFKMSYPQKVPWYTSSIIAVITIMHIKVSFSSRIDYLLWPSWFLIIHSNCEIIKECTSFHGILSICFSKVHKRFCLQFSQQYKNTANDLLSGFNANMPRIPLYKSYGYCSL